MLRQFKSRQIEGEPPRSWFSDEYIDLYIWHAPDGAPQTFQLCYDKGRYERAITWNGRAFCHERVDAGEDLPFDNRSPMLSGNCPLDVEPVCAEFSRRSTGIDPAAREFVLARLAELSHAEQQHDTR